MKLLTFYIGLHTETVVRMQNLLCLIIDILFVQINLECSFKDPNCTVLFEIFCVVDCCIVFAELSYAKYLYTVQWLPHIVMFIFEMLIPFT